MKQISLLAKKTLGIGFVLALFALIGAMLGKGF